MIVRLELRDKNFTLLELLDQEMMNLTWEFNRVGGCGSITFDLPRAYCDEKSIGGDFNLRLYVRNPTTKVYDLWFQGIVEMKSPNVQGNDETIQIQGHGYQAQLSRIQLVNVTRTAIEASVLVKYLLDNYVTPLTDITYDVGDLTATSFTFDSITFNTDVLSAIQTIADTVGAREWGVDKNRKFYFKARSSSVGLRFALGDKVTSFNNDDSFKDVVNRVIIQGGDIAGAPFAPDPTTSYYNDLASQLKFGRRDQIFQNSSILTDTVARQFSASILAEYRDVIRMGRCELSNYEAQIESTIPIPLFNLITRRVLYDEKLYDTFLYSDQIDYIVNRIVYKLNAEDSSITTNIELGQPLPNVSETIGQLKYQIEQLRAASV